MYQYWYMLLGPFASNNSHTDKFTECRCYDLRQCSSSLWCQITLLSIYWVSYFRNPRLSNMIKCASGKSIGNIDQGSIESIDSTPYLLCYERPSSARISTTTSVYHVRADFRNSYKGNKTGILPTNRHYLCFVDCSSRTYCQFMPLVTPFTCTQYTATVWNLAVLLAVWQIVA